MKSNSVLEFFTVMFTRACDPLRLAFLVSSATALFWRAFLLIPPNPKKYVAETSASTVLTTWKFFYDRTTFVWLTFVLNVRFWLTPQLTNSNMAAIATITLESTFFMI